MEKTWIKNRKTRFNLSHLPHSKVLLDRNPWEHKYYIWPGLSRPLGRHSPTDVVFSLIRSLSSLNIEIMWYWVFRDCSQYADTHNHRHHQYHHQRHRRRRRYHHKATARERDPWMLSVSLTSGSLVRGGRVVTPHVSQRDIGMSSFPRVDTTKSGDEAIFDTDQSNPFPIWKIVVNFKVTYLVSSRNHASATVRLPEIRQRLLHSRHSFVKMQLTWYDSSHWLE